MKANPHDDWLLCESSLAFDDHNAQALAGLKWREAQEEFRNGVDRRQWKANLRMARFFLGDGVVVFRGEPET